jgi:O-antigen ligase
MTDATFQGQSVSRRRGTSGGTGFVSRSRLNTIVMWILFGLLLLLPLFLGGNRPMAWAIGATILSMIGTFYFLSLLASDEAPRIRIGEIGPPAVLVAVFMGYIVVQILPIAGLLPQSMSALPAGLPPTASISISAGDTLLALPRWIDIALVAYLSIQVAANSFRAQRFLSLLFAVAVTHAVYGMLLLVQFGDTILFTEKWAYKGFATGAFVNRNSFATMLAVGACIGAVRIADAFQKRPQTGGRGFWLLDLRQGPLLTMIGQAIILITLVATGSRMGVTAGVVGMLVTLILFAAKSPTLPGRSRRGLWPYAVGTVVVVGLGYLYGMPLMDRFASVDVASVVRLQLYEQILGMIADRPLTGFGGGTFEYAYPLYHQSPVNLDYLWDRAHSSYLALWSEYGIVFGSLPIAAVILMLGTLVVGLMRSGKPDAFLIAATAGTVAVALHSLVDFSLEMHAMTLFYTALLAGGVGKALSIRQGVDGSP